MAVKERMIAPDDIVPAKRVATLQLEPDTLNCIVCDKHVNPKEAIVVFEFAGFGVEAFTFPKGRQSVWDKFATELAAKGGIPRWLGNGCHHGKGCE